MLRTRHRPNKRRAPKRTIAVLLAMILVALGVKAGATMIMPRMVEVPGLVGLTKGQAAAAAKKVGLDILVIDTKRDPEVPKGEVIEQSPTMAPNHKLEEGSSIELIVSSGPPLAKVPSMIGKAVEDATAALKAKHLEVSVAKQFSLEPEGTVLHQEPVGVKLEWGENVGLVVSKGPEPTEIPAVEGMKAEKAIAKLEAAGFQATPVDAYSDKVDEGVVISTSPEAGEVVGEGSEIKVYVSVGPEYREFRMPDVRGMNVDAAKSRLVSLGLRVDVRESCAGGTTVAETQPIAGTKVRENDPVALFVC